MRRELTNEMCLEIADLIEGYAIGALEDQEMLRVADQIGDCPEQQEQLRHYEETVGLLGLATTPIEPSAALWERLDRSTSEPAVPAPVPLRPPARGRLIIPNWAAAALAAAAVLLLLSTVSLGVALRRATDDEPQVFDATMASYLTSGAQVIPLTALDTPDTLGWAGQGSVLVAPDKPPVVVVDKCVPSSKGYTYVVWLKRDNQRTPMGDIVINKDGRGMMTLEGVDSLDGYDELGISIHTSNDWVYDVFLGSPSQKN